MTITFTLALKPVSSNRRLIPARGRWVADPAYRAYRMTVSTFALKAAREQGWKITTVPVSVVITLGKACSRIDVDAPIKVILDGIQGVLIGNDKHVTAVLSRRSYDHAAPAVQVEVTTI